MQISIVIPTFNYARYLPRAIDSVLASQKNYEVELIIIDDGSEDETAEIVASYIEKKPGIIYRHQAKKGPAAARNLGIGLSQGDYVLFLDADDELTPNALTDLVASIKNSNHCPIIVGNHETISLQGKLISHPLAKTGPKPIENALLYLNRKLSVVTGAVAVRRDVFNKVLFSEALSHYEDFVFYLQCLANYQAVTMPSTLVRIHAHLASQRRSPDRLNLNVEELTDLTFKEGLIPPELFKYKSYFMACRHLSLFRSCLIEQQNKEARLHYHQALKTKFSVLFKLRYLRKYCRSYLYSLPAETTA